MLNCRNTITKTSIHYDKVKCPATVGFHRQELHLMSCSRNQKQVMFRISNGSYPSIIPNHRARGDIGANAAPEIF